MIHTQNIVDATRVLHPEVAQNLSVWNEACTAPDAFAAAVPEAACDVTFLFHGAEPASPVVLLQLLLRTFCTLQKTVSAVALQEDRIEIQVDEARLVIGPTQLARPQGEGYFRPEGVDNSRDCARLSLFLDNRVPGLRLRVSHTMNPALLDDIACLLMRLNMPKAVLLTDSKIVLKRTEFESLTCVELARLRKGQRLAALSKRFARPRARKQSPLAVSPFRSNSAATLKAQTIRAERTVTSFCDNRKNAAIARAFRETGPCDIRADAEEDNSLCDAIILKTTHSRVRVLAPLMVATMVLFNSAALVAAASQYVPWGVLG